MLLGAELILVAQVSLEASTYLNRLSDFLFVASRWVNARRDGDVLWQPGATQT